MTNCSQNFYIDYRLVNEARKVTSKIRLSDFYLRSDIVQRKDNYDSFTRGLLTQPPQGQDQFFTEEVCMTVIKTYISLFEICMPLIFMLFPIELETRIFSTLPRHSFLLKKKFFQTIFCTLSTRTYFKLYLGERIPIQSTQQDGRTRLGQLGLGTRQRFRRTVLQSLQTIMRT